MPSGRFSGSIAEAGWDLLPLWTLWRKKRSRMAVPRDPIAAQQAQNNAKVLSPWLERSVEPSAQKAARHAERASQAYVKADRLCSPDRSSAITSTSTDLANGTS